jgi:serine/threonine protein kinase
VQHGFASSKPAKHGCKPVVFSTEADLPRPARGGGQGPFCGGSWPDLLERLCVRRSVFSGPPKVQNTHRSLGALMLEIFKHVAEAIVENGVSGLASMVPGGDFAVAVVKSAWLKMRERRKADEIRADIQAIAQTSFEEARKAANDAARYATGESTPPIELELYLAQIPAAVKQSLKRPEDPSGKTVPSGFSLRSPDEMAQLLPPRPPRFRCGGSFPGKPGWVLEKPLGVGGFGEVWLARHPHMTALCGAVKFCHGSQGHELKHEGGIINQVMKAGEHPNIVRLIDAYLEGETPWLMFEYVPGGDLAEWILALRRYPPDQRITQVVKALRQLASAVGHFHRLTPAVVHRDLKPANILTDKATRRLRITDFGIGGITAQANLMAEARGTITQGEKTLSYLRGSHTPLYASPQQKEGTAPDPRDDVHALGVIGYQLITGHLNQGAGPDFAEDLRENTVPEDLVTLLRRCVSRSPDRRPRSGEQLAEELRQIGAGSAVTQSPPVAPVVASFPEPPRNPTASAASVLTPPKSGPLPSWLAPTDLSPVTGPRPTATAPVASVSTTPTSNRSPAITPTAPAPVINPPTSIPSAPSVAAPPTRIETPRSIIPNVPAPPVVTPGTASNLPSASVRTPPVLMPPDAELKTDDDEEDEEDDNEEANEDEDENESSPRSHSGDSRPELSLEEAITALEKEGGHIGASSTVGHKLYQTAARLRFVQCLCGWDDPDYKAHDFIARNSRGTCYYVSHNLQTGKITVSTYGFHWHHPEVPECLSNSAPRSASQRPSGVITKSRGKQRNHLESRDITPPGIWWARSLKKEEYRWKFYMTPARIDILKGEVYYLKLEPNRDEDLIGLDALADVQQLETISLEDCAGLSAIGFSHLAKLRYLKKLKLDNSSVDDGALQFFRGLDALEELDLGGTRVA